MLSTEEFKRLVQVAPLFSIDLVMLNSHNEILVGRRRNAPAKGYWFVPGGRVYKGESLNQAFKRISKTELGVEFSRDYAHFLGLFDHFYSDSFFSAEISTHYINSAYALKYERRFIDLPNNQHSNYKWLSIDALLEDQKVHAYSKVFIPILREIFISD